MGQRPRITWDHVALWIGIVGGVATLLSLGVTAWNHIRGASKTHLTYVVNPTRTLVADPRVSSRLQVMLGKERVSAPVNASQVMILNPGARSIKPTDMLRDLRIALTPPASLIDVRIPKPQKKYQKMHELVKMTATSDPQTRDIIVKWQILREGDAAIVQVVYFGEPKITVDGSTEDQTDLDFIPLDRDGKMTAIRAWTWPIIGLLLLSLLALVFMFSAGPKFAMGVGALIFFLSGTAALWIVLRILITPELPLDF